MNNNCTNNYNPSDFIAFKGHYANPVANVTGDGTQYTLVVDTIDYNVDNCYNAGTGLFTSSNSGYYAVISILRLYNITPGGSTSWYNYASLTYNVSTGATIAKAILNSEKSCDSDGKLVISASDIVYLAKGNTLSVIAQSSKTTPGLSIGVDSGTTINVIWLGA